MKHTSIKLSEIKNNNYVLTPSFYLRNQKRKIKVRFNLGKGENYMKWKIEYYFGSKVVKYLSPEERFIMINCKLKNNRSKAEKIFNGETKSVCAWVLCENIEFLKEKEINEKLEKINYNPKKNPFWYNETGKDIDNLEINEIYSINKNLYIKK